MKASDLKEGDIIRVFHFIGSRRKKHYMYKIIAIKKGELVAMDILELYELGREKAHACRLESVAGAAEILERKYIEGELI